MRWIGRNIFIIATCAIFMALYGVVLFQLIGRGLGISFLIAEDASSILFIWFVMGGMVVAYQLREHLEVDLLNSALAPRLSRGSSQIWSIFIHLAQLVFLGLFSAGLFVMAKNTWSASFGSLVEFRFGYLYLGVLVCSLSAMIFVVTALCRNLRSAPGKETNFQ